MYTMRDLLPSDRDGYAGLLEQLTALEGARGGFGFDQAWARVCDGPVRVRVAECDGRVVASGTLLVEPKFFRRAPYAGHIEDLVVDARHRGRGVCRLVVDDLLELALASGCYRVTLNCSAENVGLYRKLGFASAGACMRVDLARTSP